MAKNAAYVRGRRFEYARRKFYREAGCACVRSAGSHGPWDLCAVAPDGTVFFEQCKVTQSEATVARLGALFYEKPFLPKSCAYRQILAILCNSNVTAYAVFGESGGTDRL